MKKLSNPYLNFLSIFLSFNLLLPSSWAYPPPQGLNSTASPVLNCDDFCSRFGPSEWSGSGQPKPVGLLSTSVWDPNIDGALCCDLARGNSSYQTTNCSKEIPSPAPSFSLDTCAGANGVVVTQSILNALPSSAPAESYGSFAIQPAKTISEICNQAGKMMDRCLYRNSQVETQCLAYNLLTGNYGNKNDNVDKGITADKILAATNLATAATCGIACFFMNPPAMAACSAAATAEGAAELAVTLSIQKSMEPVLDEFKASGGANPGILGIHGTAGNAVMTAVGAGGMGLGVGNGVAAYQRANELKNAVSNGESSSNAGKKALACGTAAFYAALSGIRLAAVFAMESAKTNACEKIRSYFTPGSPTPTIITTSTPPTNSNSSGNQPPGSGGSSSGGAGSGITGGIPISTLAAVASCISGGSGVAPRSPKACAEEYRVPTLAGATDANLLTKGAIGPILQNIPNPEGLSNALRSGVGAALASALPPEAGGIAEALGNIAKVAQDNAVSLSGALGLGPVSATYSEGGSRGNSGGSAGDSAANPFFGKFGSMGGGKSTTDVTTFDSGPLGFDIWHSKTNQSLFEIISDKIVKVTNRVSNAR